MSSRPPFPWNPGRPAAHLPQPLRRFRVVLHRSADAGLTAILTTVRDLTRFGEAEATHRMWEVHHRGRADVLVTHLERAELYVEQFADRGLRATVEPA
jgi:ATP-dependent Clp protease adaptor protein ClpS